MFLSIFLISLAQFTTTNAQYYDCSSPEVRYIDVPTILKPRTTFTFAVKGNTVSCFECNGTVLDVKKYIKVISGGLDQQITTLRIVKTCKLRIGVKYFIPKAPRCPTRGKPFFEGRYSPKLLNYSENAEYTVCSECYDKRNDAAMAMDNVGDGQELLQMKSRLDCIYRVYKNSAPASFAALVVFIVVLVVVLGAYGLYNCL